MKNLSWIAVALLAAACSTEPQKPAPEPQQPAASAPAPQGAAVARSAPAMDPLKDPNSILAKRSIYYDLDKFEIKPESRAVVEAHAKYLREHPNAKIRIEGNADERGSREYNLALGQKRSGGVAKAMSLLGAPDRNIEAVSYGAEKPRAGGHDEPSWSENRRSDIVYQ
jgi:peptidoglycan-associated lipoprotein